MKIFKIKKIKKAFIISFICLLYFCSQNAYAVTASATADKAINVTAKTAYFITKYTLKAGWFIIKKTVKGSVIISKSIFSGTKDAFKSAPAPKPVVKTNQNNYSNIIPSNHEIYKLPSAPNI